MREVRCTPLPTPPDPVRAALTACPALAALPRALVDSTAEQAWLRSLTTDEAVFRAGDPGDAMFVVASGRISTRLSSPEGDALDLAVVRAGTLFGYFELFDGGTRSTDAIAGGPSRVVVIGAAAAARLLDACPELVLALARDMAAIVRASTGALHEHAFYPAQARLARFLLAAAGPDDRIRLDGPQALLAQRLGVARQTLSRALRRLATDGLVRVDASGRMITILDRDGIDAIAVVPARQGSVRAGRQEPAAG